MGREAIAVARWRGAVEEVKVLLEAHEIVLRGAIKARIPRVGISGLSVEDDSLFLHSDGELLVLELGEREAVKWHASLLKPPPSLADKLGISAGSPVFAMGDCSDPDLSAALTGATCPSPGQASILLAIITSESDLSAAMTMARQHPKLFLWCVYGKGKSAAFGDAAIRAFLRERGYIDSKSCAISADLTATRYGLKIGKI
jgi:hypothetical protein